MKSGIILGICGLLFTALFYYGGIWRLDPDFGWHIRIGQMMIDNHGIIPKDPFTYTMPDYPWVDHEWLTDILLSWSFPRIGMMGLSVVFAIIAAAALLISYPLNAPIISIIAPVLAFPVLFVRGGVRPQVIDWLFISILLLIFNSVRWKKLRLLLPLIFLFWANLHGGFVIGLGFMCLHYLSMWREKKNIQCLDYILILSSFLISLINPYGIRLWHEIWMSLSDSNLRWSIAEWQPFYTSLEPSFWLLAGLVFSFGYIYRRKISDREYIYSIVALISGIMSVRMMPIFALVSIRFISKGFCLLEEDIHNKISMIQRARKVYLFFGVLVGIIFCLNTGFLFNEIFHEPIEFSYPYCAIHFLKNKPFIKNVFAPYEWGGYLEWQIPDLKLFIDGRMPSWRWKSPNPRESDWAFREYQQINISGDYSKIFEKYNINTVVWRKNKMNTSVLDKYLSNIINIKTEIAFDFPAQLVNRGWIKVYDDGVTCVYQKI
jgi:hypothetical protein